MGRNYIPIHYVYEGIFLKNTLEKKSSIKNGIKRMVFIGASFIIETTLIVLLFTSLYNYAEVISIIMRVLGVITILYIYGQPKTSAMKMPWIILILALPAFGIALFLTIGFNASPRLLSRNFLDINRQVMSHVPDNDRCADKLKRDNRIAYGISNYVKNNSGFPVYENGGVKYFSQATDGLDAIIEDLKKAEKFIFMEYFAIENSDTWKRVEKVLVEKASEGVEVRVFYDDIGSIGFVNLDFSKHLNSLGIKCKVFNPCVVGWKLILNHRDHRKITIIDGKIAYTGGFNLANEYFGVTHPYGEWKDTGIRIEGTPVNSYTAAFLAMWNFDRKKLVTVDPETDIKPYLTYDENLKAIEGKVEDASEVSIAETVEDTSEVSTAETAEDKLRSGYIHPYADTPLDHENLGEEIYISIINQAQEYCYFITPYLIVTDEMLHALRLAAKRGVDVRIITPGIPDKKVVYRLTRSYYSALIKSGVRIYEWTPGFCHAKVCVSDDKLATCGTINLDYRSLYHNFEDGCLMIEVDAIKDIKADFDNTFEESKEVTGLPKYHRKTDIHIIDRILRLFAEFL